MSAGLFVALEGIDGSGKTTVRRYLFTELRARGHDVLSTQGYYWLVPEHTEVIVNARFHRRPYPVRRITDAYLADKHALSTDLLIPHLRHRSVVCDRHMVSDVVTQVLTWGADIDETYRRYLDSPIRRPDLILFLDTPPDVSVARIAANRGRSYPWEKRERLEQAYELFVNLLFSSRPAVAPVLRIRNIGSLTTVLDQTLNAVLDRLAANEPPPCRRPSPAPLTSTASGRNAREG